MIRKKVLTLALLPLFLLACNSNESASNSATSENQVENKQAEETTGPESPCELISEADVRSLFAIPDEIQIEVKDRVLTYPTCTYIWKDEKVTKIIQAGPKEMHIKMASELMIVMVKDAGESMYNTSIKVYKDIESVENVGEMASWGTEMAQLTFLAKGYMFHVHVKASDDDMDNKAKAIEVARLIIGKL